MSPPPRNDVHSVFAEVTLIIIIIIIIMMIKIIIIIILEEEKWALNDYIKNSTEHALKAVSNEELLKLNESKSEYHKKELKNRQEQWQSKPLHGQSLKDIKDKTDKVIVKKAYIMEGGGGWGYWLFLFSSKVIINCLVVVWI